MIEQIKMVMDFHRAFNVPIRHVPSSQDESDERQKEMLLRKRLMTKEVKEWYEAAQCNALDNERVKELADILYTAFGTIISEGYQDIICRVFEEVHKSNMSKLEYGVPLVRPDGKILKGRDYYEPDLSFVDEFYNDDTFENLADFHQYLDEIYTHYSNNMSQIQTPDGLELLPPESYPLLFIDNYRNGLSSRQDLIESLEEFFIEYSGLGISGLSGTVGVESEWLIRLNREFIKKS